MRTGAEGNNQVRISTSHWNYSNAVISRVYGTQTTPPPPILKAIPKIFAHSDKTVRAEGTLLVQTIYQYIGPGIEPWLADLKPVQIKELKESFDSMESDGKGKGTLKPERLTRTQAREAEANAGQGDGGQDDAAEDAGMRSSSCFLLVA